MKNQIHLYIDSSLKYALFEILGDRFSITNSKIPGFSFISGKKDKELLIIEYKDYLYKYIEKKLKGNEFIPIIDRIDLNTERVIKAFDPTLEENKQALNEIVQIEIIKSKGE